LGHLPDPGIIDIPGGESLSQVIADACDIVFVHANIEILEDFIDVPSIGRCIDKYWERLVYRSPR